MSKYPVAIVTGAGRGIGKAVAEGLASDGYKTILVSRTKDQLKAVAGQIETRLGEGSAYAPSIHCLDITKYTSVQKLIRQIIRSYGRIDILVNNAGLWIAGSVNISAKDFQTLWDINLNAAFYLMKEVIPIMKKQGKGYIFNISSRSGKIGFIDAGAYSAAKFGLVGLSESLHRELAPQGIKVTALCPSWVDTIMAQEAETPLPGEEMLRPEDIMETVRWLLRLSPVASVKEVMIECRKNIA